MNKETTPPLPAPEEFLKPHCHYLPEHDIRVVGEGRAAVVLKEYTKQVVHYTLQQAAENAKLSHKTEETKAYLGRAVNSWSEVDKQSILSLEEQIIKDLKL